tara:strand:+ start:17 stop:2383 length:2367 start_codon:yes stop_codon:yes gene_type:complete
MAIIYSYPSETDIQASDLLIGTSTVVQNGVKENVTRSYSIQSITDYIRTLGGLGVTSIAFSAPLTGGTITTTGTVGITQSSAVSNGYLSSADWTTFNSKLGGVTGVQDAITYWSSPTSLGSSSLSDPTGGTTITSSKIFAPTVDSSIDIGISGTQRWRNLFLSGTAGATNFNGTNLTLTGTLSANGSTGANLQVLQSQGAGAVQWVDLSASYDRYDLNAGAKTGTSIPFNLTSTSGTDNSVINLTQGTNITLDRNSATQVTINSTDEFEGTVTSVTTDTPNTILVAGTAAAPTLSTVTAAPGAANNGLSTGAQIQTAISDALVGFLEFKGGFRADSGLITSGINTGLFLYNCPGGAGTRIAIDIGDFYIVETAGGDFYCSAQDTLAIGDQIVCSTAAVADASLITSWTQIQQNIGIATATALGIANFPTAGGLTIAAGAVSAVGFASVAIAGNAGYVPDSTAAAANTFLAKDGTWTVGPAAGVSNITFNTGLTGGTISAGGSTVTVDYSTATNVILSSGADTTTIIDTDTFLFGTGNNVGYGIMSALKTYIGAGAGTVTGTGTQYTIPVWSNGAGTAVSDSMLAQNAGATILTNTGSFTTTSIIDSAGSPGGNGEVLTAGAAGGAVTWGTAAASYTKWILNDQASGTQDIDDGDTVVVVGANSISTAVTAAGTVNTLTITSAAYGGGATVGHVPAGGSAGKYLDGATGAWITLPAGVPTILKERFTATANQTTFTLTTNPTDINYVNVFISGVYQNNNTFSVVTNGSVKDIVTTALPLGTVVECVSTT